MIPRATMEEALALAADDLGSDLDVLVVPHALLTLPVVSQTLCRRRHLCRMLTKKRLTVERVYSDPNLSGPTPIQLKFSPDGKRITYLRPKDEDAEHPRPVGL